MKLKAMKPFEGRVKSDRHRQSLCLVAQEKADCAITEGRLAEGATSPALFEMGSPVSDSEHVFTFLASQTGSNSMQLNKMDAPDS